MAAKIELRSLICRILLTVGSTLLVSGVADAHDPDIIVRLKSLGAEIQEYGERKDGKPLPQIHIGLKGWRAPSSELELLTKLPPCDLLEISADHSTVDDNGVKVLASLTHLTRLSLSRTHITGKALLHLLAAKSSLASLSLRETGISDADLVPLSRMSHLTNLDLSKTRVKGLISVLPHSLESLELSGTRLESLSLVDKSQRTALVELRLDETGATDSMLTDVQNCPNLANLWLQDTRVTDRGLVRISGLRKLMMLRLDGLAITDSGLNAIRPLTEMRWLTLTQTKITDAGLVSLSGMKHLEDLCLLQTSATAEGVRKLESRLGHPVETDIVTEPPTARP
jgi:hypothetical protein